MTSLEDGTKRLGTETRANGSRIKLARELRGLTQQQLAEGVGVSQSAIVKYEKDAAQPTEENLRKVALHTGFPPRFFRLQSMKDVPLGTHLLYRAKASAAVYQQVRAHRLAEIINEAIDNLSTNLQLYTPNIPRLEESPSTSASLTRSQLGLSPDKPIEKLVRTIERAGVRVIALPLDIEDIDAFSFWVGDGGATPVIGVMSNRPGDRTRWSIAHELGHLVLHRVLKGPLREAERDAHAFAAEFLLPESAMRQEITQPVTLTEIASLKPRWKVSMQALIRRARDLDIISPRQYTYLMTQVSARGWRKREPANLDVPKERPRLLTKMCESLFQLPLPYERIAERLSWTSQFTREVLSRHADHTGAPQEDPGVRGIRLEFKDQNRD